MMHIKKCIAMRKKMNKKKNNQHIQAAAALNAEQSLKL